ncbi:AAA family ATPase [Allonocardiopsis opalescens]|uniref:Dynein-related subfamily AAA family protein n=1 Tax=Allonocardiopsis opalescens TaxID=1144618 RepID=A0A2T0QFT1_9ACTN|nr:MoxR family ATPase [Allonocardiopsis opalescens]PRY02701.1 dynein-related subfamily AAA family protein [Allonocardiopsis opalescens]
MNGVDGQGSGQARPAPRPADDWRVYRGTGEPHDGWSALPPPPPWREFGPPPAYAPADDAGGEPAPGDLERARTYRPAEHVVDLVNAALYLRRPLLVTGKAGVGKSTLAHSIAYELRLGPVLTWPVTSRSELRHGLYDYDAIGRLQETPPEAARSAERPPPGIGRYIRLGPLGTALLPRARPRVLLVDELDKGDIDLPNDLLHIFEEGDFTLPELQRLPDARSGVEVMTSDPLGRARVEGGRVRCHAFPVVVITSNAEREFPPAFLRRCVRLEIQPHSAEALAEIVATHLGEAALSRAEPIIERFLAERRRGEIATDQLLNAVQFAMAGVHVPDGTRSELIEQLLRPLDLPGST